MSNLVELLRVPLAIATGVLSLSRLGADIESTKCIIVAVYSSTISRSVRHGVVPSGRWHKMSGDGIYLESIVNVIRTVSRYITYK